MPLLLFALHCSTTSCPYLFIGVIIDVEGFSLGTIGCDLLALVDGFTPVEDNIGEALLEAKNDVDLWEAPLGAVGFSAVGW
ncbi:hypothetical protein Tco_0964626 [Tanacetum coccineum]